MAKATRSALTLDEALALLCEEDAEGEVEKADVIIVPPDADELTDEEDVNDDIIGEISIQDVPGTLEVHVDKEVTEECAIYKDKPTRKKKGNSVTLNQCGNIRILNIAKSRGALSITLNACRK